MQSCEEVASARLYITRLRVTTESLSGVMSGIYHTATSYKDQHPGCGRVMINLDINNYLGKISIYHVMMLITG